MLRWDKEKKSFLKLPIDRGQEHEDKVEAIDIHLGLGLIVTGDNEGLVKIWNRKKQVVREIKFTEPITAVCFLNEQADLLIGH